MKGAIMDFIVVILAALVSMFVYDRFLKKALA